MATKKYVYYFGDGKADGAGDMKDLLGGKGAGLAEMTNLGISVPAGFTITTEACIEYYRRKKMYPPGLWDEALHALKKSRAVDGHAVWGSREPIVGLGSLRRARVDAGNDGHGVERGVERSHRRRVGGQNEK